ncbi:MAG: triose-phosphate isomerase [Bacteroidota bacterium]
MNRKCIVAGNWKMNKDFSEGLSLALSIVDGTPNGKTEVVIGTPFIHLQAVADIVVNHPKVHLAAQNCSTATSGAYTGEISVDMLTSVGASYVIIGHSERRQLFGETSAQLLEKVKQALQAGLTPIFCCGEPLDIREAGTHVDYVAQQLKEGLAGITAEEFAKIVIAYEPIWAIGTGVTASPAQAQQMHQAIRSQIAHTYDGGLAEATTILYGGSVKPANAADLFSQVDVDGGLVGGASLKPETFLPIIEAMEAELAAAQ